MKLATYSTPEDAALKSRSRPRRLKLFHLRTMALREI